MTSSRTPAEPIDPADLGAIARLVQGSGKVLESRIDGTSMGDSIPHGVRVRIECGDVARYDPGEVVAFILRGQLVAHRIVARGRRRRARRFVITLGDGRVVCDPPVAEQAIVGRVTTIDRGDRWVPVPPAPRRRGVHRLIAMWHRGMVRAALELHARAAAAVAEAGWWLLAGRRRILRRWVRNPKVGPPPE